MPWDSGTPADWLSNLPGEVMGIHCVCPAGIAAERFMARRRHAGHLDVIRSSAEISESIEMAAGWAPPEIYSRIVVDTSGTVDIFRLLDKIVALKG